MWKPWKSKNLGDKDSEVREPRKAFDKAFEVTWDGAVLLKDPKAYFGDSESVRKHVDFVRRHQQLLEKQSKRRVSE